MVGIIKSYIEPKINIFKFFLESVSKNVNGDYRGSLTSTINLVTNFGPNLKPVALPSKTVIIEV